MDVFYKMQALKEQGIQIILHAFQYNREPAEELWDVCEEIHYYARKSIGQSLPIGKPHIVKSRQHPDLLNRLFQDDIPVFFEGLHTTSYLAIPDMARRKKLVRMHNVEWDYYHQLALQERNPMHRQYYTAESRLLKSYEQVLEHADHILPISPPDTAYYQDRFEGVEYLPAFHPYNRVETAMGRGTYCLYHGNLQVIENEQAIFYLIRDVFAHLDIPLIIAGNHPGESLIRLISAYDHITLAHDPDETQMRELLAEAHIHVLPTFQATGIKLKLLTSLHQGRFVLVNEPMVRGTGLELAVEICRSSEEFRAMIRQLWETPFSAIDIAQREASLGNTFSNVRNAEKLVEIIRR